MTCSRLLSKVARAERHRPSKSVTAATKGATTRIRGIATRSLPLTAASSTACSPTRAFLPPLVLQQYQNHQQPCFPLHAQHQKSQQHQQHSISGRAGIVGYSTQSDLQQQPSLPNIPSSGTSSSTSLRATNHHNHRRAHTHAALQGIVATNTKQPASGWRKPIVSSSPSSMSSLASLSSLVLSSPLTSPSNTEPDTRPPGSRSTSSSSSSSAATPSSSDETVSVDMEELLELASKKTTPLSLKDMYKYAIVDANNMEQRIRNAQFLHAELPVRIAQRAVDLLTLPHGLNEIPAVLQVAHVYLLYLEKFQDCPIPTDTESEELFTDMLQSMVLERSSIPNAIARGVDAWIQNEKAIAEEAAAAENGDDSVIDTALDENERARSLKEMEDALYRFFTARVGLRFLTEHHILSSPARIAYQLNDSSSLDDKNDTSFLGCIQPNCCPTQEVRKVVEAVRRKTMDYYGDGVCPEIQIVNGDIAAQQQPQHKKRHKTNNFTYVPHHLHYMVGELLKNACRATVKQHIENGSSGPIPPIKIVIVKGAEDVTIKIADRGGGIPRSQMSEIWKFAHSTSAKDEVENETDFGVNEITGAAIRGFGLPLARIYARYLGGELTLKSLEGHGLDAYLHLPRLGDQCENLPLPVRFSPSNLTSTPLRRPEIVE